MWCGQGIGLLTSALVQINALWFVTVEMNFIFKGKTWREEKERRGETVKRRRKGKGFLSAPLLWWNAVNGLPGILLSPAGLLTMTSTVTALLSQKFSKQQTLRWCPSLSPAAWEWACPFGPGGAAPPLASCRFLACFVCRWWCTWFICSVLPTSVFFVLFLLLFFPCL